MVRLQNIVGHHQERYAQGTTIKCFVRMYMRPGLQALTLRVRIDCEEYTLYPNPCEATHAPEVLRDVETDAGV